MSSGSEPTCAVARGHSGWTMGLIPRVVPTSPAIHAPPWLAGQLATRLGAHLKSLVVLLMGSFDARESQPHLRLEKPTPAVGQTCVALRGCPIVQYSTSTSQPTTMGNHHGYNSTKWFLFHSNYHFILITMVSITTAMILKENCGSIVNDGLVTNCYLLSH